MNTHIKTDRRARLIGSVWMVVAMAAFAVEDSLVKLASATIAVGQILIGVLLFDERLDLPILAGCALIVVSGLVILWRGQTGCRPREGGGPASRDPA